ncbi:uncharacterized protein LOC125942009 [Dermacentor silvarum]|uniref:uncharacterized protein LOC125942009 n=1 Tax=Dermacentor silvarum TaxID=543639 RepID=UPI002100AEF8|nr:uncharacterized protein LOC125942009 [Dermacentor silvarum]
MYFCTGDSRDDSKKKEKRERRFLDFLSLLSSWNLRHRHRRQPCLVRNVVTEETEVNVCVSTYDKAKRRAKKAECELAVDTTELSAMLLRVQLRHEVRVVSERLDETEPLNKTRAVSQPALSTVPPVLPRLPADNIKELEAAVRDEAVAATLRKHLLQIGGKSLREVASYAMKAVMAHPVQVLYSLHSRKGKRAFINLKLCRIVTDVICAKGGGGDLTQAQDFIKYQSPAR